MPLILITGIPSSGKSARALEIKSYFEDVREKTVHLVNENDIITASGTQKNVIFLDATKEKQVRGLIKSEAQRLISREDIVIIDAGNYIKGYRYELYCMSKAPLSSTNFLYEIDRITQDVVTAILSAQKLGLEGEVKIPGYKDCVLLTNGANMTAAQLTRLRRQFLAYTKLHPSNDISKTGLLFVQFLNTSLR
ncbi:protein KTI12 homolog isoform X2 [Cryptotermes secundus]|uniref:protein KTI12 homolog isoform X2 n=1 Tax=Cryptotermes secundus TaxID=105785 RepID=UPI000CD7D9CE|nr:protein KTI12 homolog isoform X2 [Cryptotermes secundus]